MRRLPLAKRNNIIQQESGSELLLYNLQDNKAYCLNSTSAIVYQYCDGLTDFELLRSKFKMPEELIILALQRLETEGLLEGKSEFANIPRRKLLMKLGMSAIALPMISNVIAPTAAQAASSSCVNPGGAAPGTIISVCVGPVANCALACQSPAVSVNCCSGTSGLGLCGASCNCVCV